MLKNPAEQAQNVNASLRVTNWTWLPSAALTLSARSAPPATKGKHSKVVILERPFSTSVNSPCSAPPRSNPFST
jgi:hypothetical protein